ncbi:MAG TPA: NAD-dependent epimerase/dehydratase family protein [Caulobacteraceae bacterium]|jgi:nucleoside-diphosphate-sugar epimerase
MEAAAPVLVLGATSLVGRFAVPKLVASGRRVVALSREGREPATGVAWVSGDLNDRALALPGAAAALSLSPIWLLPDALPALKAAGVRRLIAFSSTSRFTKAASPEPEERAVAERLEQGEARTIAFCEAEGIAWTIFRPTMIYAEGQDQNVSRLAGLVRRFGVLPLSGAGQGRRQPVHAEDLAEACLLALDRPETFGRAYDLPGGETLSYRAMVERVFEGLGRTKRVLPLPPAVWRLAFRVASPRGATAAMGERMAEDLVFDGAPAARDFGWRPRPFRPRF